MLAKKKTHHDKGAFFLGLCGWFNIKNSIKIYYSKRIWENHMNISTDAEKTFDKI